MRSIAQLGLRYASNPYDICSNIQKLHLQL
ncbi:hypothetical protein ELQ35_19970 [Peribacillus cavernae]|uniref:Uncharacterized protein n=1 Tax=Peribacillus cavernae TaxID=1674310 RepID=A0A3S0W2Z2_9BACI|nr:hypothetical protein ELQ35_19970 [Peribacillus cavernae]